MEFQARWIRRMAEGQGKLKAHEFQKKIVTGDDVTEAEPFEFFLILQFSSRLWTHSCCESFVKTATHSQKMACTRKI